MPVFIRIPSDKFEVWQRLATPGICILYIIVILFLSTITTTKLKIEKYIYY